MHVSTYSNFYRADAINSYMTSFDDLIAYLRQNTKNGENDKKQMPCFSPIKMLKTGRQADNNVDHVSCLVLDLDKTPKNVIPDVLKYLKEHAYFLYSTYSYVENEDFPHLRAVLPLSEPVPADAWRGFWRSATQRLERDVPGLVVDPTCKNPSRIYALPGSPGGDGFDQVNEGGVWDVAPFLEVATAAAPAPTGREALLNDVTPAIPELTEGKELQQRKVRAQRYLLGVPPAVSGEGGDMATFKAAATGHNMGLTQEQFLPLLLVWNQTCQPPWGLQDIVMKIENAYSYSDRPFGSGLVAAVMEDMGISGLGVKEVAAPAEGVPILRSAAEGEIADHYWAAQKGPEGNMKSNGEEVFVYGGDGADGEAGVWSRKSKTLLRAEIGKYHGEQTCSDAGELGTVSMTRSKMEAVASLVAHRYEALDEGFLVRPPAGVAFKNGFVAVAGGGVGVVLQEHDAKNRALWGLDYDIDLDAPLPEGWLAMLEGIFAPDDDAAQKIQALQEWSGAMILGVATQYARLPLLWGPRGSGKSTFMDTIEGLLPRSVRAAIKPHEWGEDYKRAKLQGVRLNAVGEIPERDILASDYFKQIVTGETTTARMPYGRPFEFSPQAGHIFSANALPGTVDNSSGFWGRVMVIPFNRSFVKEGTPIGTKDDFVGAALDEAPAIMAWALRGANTLIQRGAYALPPSHHTALELWRNDTDAVADFVASCCSRDISGKPEKLANIHRAFRRWSAGVGRQHLSARKLAVRIRQLDVTETTRMHKGKVKGPVTFQMQVLPAGDWMDFDDPSIQRV